MPDIVSIYPSYLLPSNVLALSGRHACWLRATSSQLINFYQGYGYEYIIPPVWEFDDAITFDCQDLATRSIKLVDQKSGRLLAFRADNTLQAIRMYGHEAHQFPMRLCYANQVFHHTSHTLSNTRHPFQVGVELLGTDSLVAFLQIMELALHTFTQVGLTKPHVVINHTSLINAISDYLELTTDKHLTFVRCIRYCEHSSVELLIDCINWEQLNIGNLDPKALFNILLKQDIGTNELAVLKDIFSGDALIISILDQFDQLLGMLNSHLPTCSFLISFSDTTTYSYHHGLVFSIYHKEFALPVIQGGQYRFKSLSVGGGDLHCQKSQVGQATYCGIGFSLDLFFVMDQCTKSQICPKLKRIWLPLIKMTDSLKQYVSKLRRQGDVVVAALDSRDKPTAACTHVLNSQGSMLPISQYKGTENE